MYFFQWQLYIPFDGGTYGSFSKKIPCGLIYLRDRMMTIEYAFLKYTI